MSKSLTLIRHGKSSWVYQLDDHDRPLKKRAYDDIRLISEAAKSEINADASFFSSSANRAQTTARLFLTHLGISEYKLKILPELYTFNHSTLKNIIQKTDNALSSIVIFGHNPAFTMLANEFGTKYFSNIPTSGFVKLHFENTRWKDCEKAQTVLHLFPKNLRP